MDLCEISSQKKPGFFVVFFSRHRQCKIRARTNNMHTKLILYAVLTLLLLSDAQGWSLKVVNSVNPCPGLGNYCTLRLFYGNANEGLCEGNNIFTF